MQVNPSQLRERFQRGIAPEGAFYQMFNHLPGISFFAKDNQFRIVAANRQFYQRFGFQEELEIIGKNDYDLFPSRLAENFRKDDTEVMGTGKPMLNIVELFFNQQGIPDWFMTNKAPVKDYKGRVIGIMGTTQSYETKKQVIQPFLQIDKAVNYIRENFRKKVSVEELADMVYLSSRQLHRRFVEAFGCSPQAFIMKLRIQAASEALQQEAAQISEVAREVGFGDQSSFTQHFQKHIGITPLRYQRQFRLRRP